MHYSGTEHIEGQSDTTHNEHCKRVLHKFKVDEPLHGLQENGECQCKKEYTIKKCADELRAMHRICKTGRSVPVFLHMCGEERDCICDYVLGSREVSL